MGTTGRLFKYNTSLHNWSQVANQSGSETYILSFTTYDDGTGNAIFGGTTPSGKLLKYNTSLGAWLQVAAQNSSQTQVHSLTVYDDGTGNALFGGTYNAGYLFKYNRSLGGWLKVADTLSGQNGMVKSTVYNDGYGNALYAISTPNGLLAKYNSTTGGWVQVASQVASQAGTSVTQWNRGTGNMIYGGTDGGWVLRYDTYTEQSAITFTTNATNGTTPLAVQFNETSNSTGTSWEWNFTSVFGNNTPVTFSTIQNATWTFSTGNYTIKLKSTNSGGSGVSAQNTWINVTGPPVSNFTSNVTIALVYPMVVQFNDTSQNSPTAWNWSFGDGRWFNTTNSSLKNTTYTYAVANKYNVSLLTSNVAGSNTTIKYDYINLTSDSDTNLTSWLHMNGSNSSTTFSDEAGLAWTTNGGAQISTNQPKYGGASGVFTQSLNSYISTPNSSALQFGTGDFTIELWVNITTVTGTNEHIFSKSNNARTQGWGLDCTNSTAGDYRMGLLDG